MRTFLNGSAITEDSDVISPDTPYAVTLILQIEEHTAVWSGTIKVMTRLAGQGAAGPWHARALVAEVNNADIDGDTGASAVGIYRCSIEGREFYIAHSRTSGAVKVSGNFATA